MYHLLVLGSEVLKDKISAELPSSAGSREEKKKKLPFPIFRDCLHSLACGLSSAFKIKCMHPFLSLLPSLTTASFLRLLF